MHFAKKDKIQLLAQVMMRLCVTINLASIKSKRIKLRRKLKPQHTYSKSSAYLY